MPPFDFFLSVKDFSGGKNVLTRKVKLNWTEIKGFHVSLQTQNLPGYN